MNYFITGGTGFIGTTSPVFCTKCIPKQEFTTWIL